MTGNKKVLCKVCYKDMRSDVLNRHMKVHETNGGSKRKHYEMEEEDAEAVRKYLIKCNNEYEEKMTLGKTVYRFLGQGVCSEHALPEEMRNALDIYMKQAQEVNHNNVELKPWQKELLEYMDHPTQKGEKSACLMKIGTVFSQKFRLRRLLPAPYRLPPARL